MSCAQRLDDPRRLVDQRIQSGVPRAGVAAATPQRDGLGDGARADAVRAAARRSTASLFDRAISITPMSMGRRFDGRPSENRRWRSSLPATGMGYGAETTGA